MFCDAATEAEGLDLICRHKPNHGGRHAEDIVNEMAAEVTVYEWDVAGGDVTASTYADEGDDPIEIRTIKGGTQ